MCARFNMRRRPPFLVTWTEKFYYFKWMYFLSRLLDARSIFLASSSQSRGRMPVRATRVRPETPKRAKRHRSARLVVSRMHWILFRIFWYFLKGASNWSRWNRSRCIWSPVENLFVLGTHLKVVSSGLSKRTFLAAQSIDFCTTIDYR